MKCLALLGLANKNWNINATLAAMHPTEPYAIQTFDNYPNGFGDPRKNLNILCAKRNIVAVEVQLVYTDAHVLIGIPYLKSRLPIWKKWQANHPNVKLYISHTTEHYEQDKAKLRERMKLIEEAGIIAVNNPEPGKGAILSEWLNETHKPRKMAGTYIASMDGFDTLVKGDVLNWVRTHKGALYNFAWSGLCNLNNGKKGSDRKTPPSKRTAAPSAKHIEMLAFISECPPEPPTPLFEVKPIRGRMLWKPVRETTGDSRDNKPCLIHPIKANHFDIVDCRGNLLGILPYYGTYKSEGHRYYSGSPGGIDLWGYEISKKAMASSGSPWVYLRANGKYWGPIEGAHRQGYF